MKYIQHCKIKILHKILLIFFMYIKGMLTVPSAEDLIYAASPELETITTFENDTFSEPFIFKYTNFKLEYIVACRIGQNVTFAIRNSQTGKLESIDRDRYDVVGGDIDDEGEFQISLRGNINEQDGNCLVCGYATNFFVMETSCIRLRITKTPVYYLEQRPDIAVTGDEVDIYCIVSGYPFPQVEFTPPFNLPIETKLISKPNETLRVIKYVSTVPYVDISWSNEEVKCRVYDDDTEYEEKIMKIFVKKYNESIVFDDQTVSTIAIICGILGAFLIGCMFLGVIVYMKKKNRRESYYCMRIPGDDNNDFDDNYNGIPHNNITNKGCNNHNENKPPITSNGDKQYPPIPQPKSNIANTNKHAINTNYHPYNHNINHIPNNKNIQCKTIDTTVNQHPPSPCGLSYPVNYYPPNLHYYPQQIINLTQKHTHIEPKNEIANNKDTKNTTHCKTPSISNRNVSNNVKNATTTTTTNNNNNNNNNEDCSPNNKTTKQKQTNTKNCNNTINKPSTKFNVSTSAYV